MGHTSRNMKTDTEGDLNYGCLAQEISDRDNISKQPRDHSGILAKSVAFFPCPKSLPEAKLKSFGTMALAEEISRQPNIEHLP